MTTPIRLDGRAPRTVVAWCRECKPWRRAGSHRLVLLEAAHHAEVCHGDAGAASDFRERAARMQARHADLGR